MNALPKTLEDIATIILTLSFIIFIVGLLAVFFNLIAYLAGENKLYFDRAFFVTVPSFIVTISLIKLTDYLSDNQM